VAQIAFCQCAWAIASSRKKMAESPQPRSVVPTFGEIEEPTKNRSRRRLPTFIIDSPSAFGIVIHATHTKLLFPAVEVSEKRPRFGHADDRHRGKDSPRCTPRFSPAAKLALTGTPSIFPPPAWA